MHVRAQTPSADAVTEVSSDAARKSDAAVGFGGAIRGVSAAFADAVRGAAPYLYLCDAGSAASKGS